ncbi:hypothetical protein QYM36_019418, partial [Artemia franciscana]
CSYTKHIISCVKVSKGCKVLLCGKMKAYFTFTVVVLVLPVLNSHTPSGGASIKDNRVLGIHSCPSNFVPRLDRQKFTQRAIRHQTALYSNTFPTGLNKKPEKPFRRKQRFSRNIKSSKGILSRKTKSLTDLLTGRGFPDGQHGLLEKEDDSHLWTKTFDDKIWPKEVSRERNKLPWFLHDSSKCSDTRGYDYDYDSGAYISRPPCNPTPQPRGEIFHGSVLVVETSANETLREILDLCTGVETYDMVEIADLEFLFEEIEKEISETDYQEPNSVVILFNVESFNEWSADKIGQSLQEILYTMEDYFAEVNIFSKFLHGDLDRNPKYEETLYKMKHVVSEYCRMDPSRCSDFSTALTGLIAKYKSNNTSNNEKPQDVANLTETTIYSKEDKSQLEIMMETLRQQGARFCRETGLGVGSRAVAIHAATYASRVPFKKTGDSSLTLSDILPLPMKSYDKNIPPKYQGQPTVVYFHVTVLSIDSINEESMTYVADIFLAQSWRDHRLRLPENMTEEYRILDVGWLQNIWRPDCFFKNAKKVTFHEMSVPNHYLWLYHDKTLLYMAKLTLVLSCAMKFEAYPFDTQICSMMIESLSHTTFDLVFRWNITDPLVVNPEIELPQLDIASNSTEDCTLEYSTGNFTCLAVVFNLRRRLGYHLFHTYIPSALIVVMSWISFWIKPEAIPARITLGVTSLLTLATQSTQSQRALPPVSYVKAIDVWMSSCTVFVFLSLMQFAIVNVFMGPVATKPMKGYSDPDISNSALVLSPEEKILLHERASRAASLQRGSLPNGR